MLTKPIKEILAAASFSPSSHNTQPWKVRYANGTLIVGYDPKRQLFIGDPQKRELFISLGCFIESVIAAARDQGYTAIYTYKGEQSSEVAHIYLGEPLATTSSDWTKLLRNRRSDRRKYTNQALPDEFVDEIRDIQDVSARLELFKDTDEIAFLTDATYTATCVLMSQKPFLNELASWVRNNWTKKHDGMPAYTQGMPGPVSLVAKVFIRTIPAVPKDQAKKDATRVKHSAAIGLITVPDHQVPQLIDAGRLYQRACLLATKNDIKTSAVSAAVIYEKTATSIKTHFKLDTPVILMRFGYAKGLPKASPRLSVEEITANTVSEEA